MILILGSTGFLGTRVRKLLDSKGLEYVGTSLSGGLDLRDRAATLRYFDEIRPEYVLNCATYVGGIQFGLKHPAELFHNNMHITLNLMEAATAAKVKRVVNPVSNCAYPGAAAVFREHEFWDGPIHESVLVYGFVRKASWVGAWAYAQQYGLDVINIVISNMYGPGDHFEEERSHALGALIMKIVRAKEQGLPQVVVWGTGKPIREWLHVDDGAEAMVRSMDVAATTDPINIGVGEGVSVIEMARLIKELVGYDGELVLDTSKPDGAPIRTVDGSRGRQHFGWGPTREFRAGVADAIESYREYARDHA